MYSKMFRQTVNLKKQHLLLKRHIDKVTSWPFYKNNI